MLLVTCLYMLLDVFPSVSTWGGRCYKWHCIEHPQVPTVTALSAKSFHTSLHPFPLSVSIRHWFWNRQYWTLKVMKIEAVKMTRFIVLLFWELLILKSLSGSWTPEFWLYSDLSYFSNLPAGSAPQTFSGIQTTRRQLVMPKFLQAKSSFGADVDSKVTAELQRKWGEPRRCLIRTSDSSNQKAPCTRWWPACFFWSFDFSFILQGTPVYSTLEPYSEYELTISYKACQLYSFWKMSHLHRQLPEKTQQDLFCNPRKIYCV